MKAQTLISNLTEETKNQINRVNRFNFLSDEVLLYRSSEDSWNILECMEHLNMYSKFYVPAIQKQISNSNVPPAIEFKSGWLGNYFANSMLPGVKPMKTFKEKNPLGMNLDRRVIEEFLQYENAMVELLHKARAKNLNTVKVPITISRFVKIRLGDTFRFVLNHNERHIVQAERVAQSIPSFSQ